MLPRFLGIGAPKCGTTWLDRNLRRHPEVWLPPRKELHFFDTWNLPVEEQRAHPARRRARARFYPRELLAHLKRGRFRRLLWDLRYLERPRTAEWYASLFPENAGIPGEITPAYATLRSSEVEPVARLLPDARLIFLIREPVSRTWSHVRMAFRLRAGGFRDAPWTRLEDVPASFLCDLVDSETYRVRGDYAWTLRNWTAWYPAEQFFVGFLDDIRREPVPFLRRVATFLRVDPQVDWPEASDVGNRGEPEPIPEALRDHLVERFRGPLVELREVLEPLGASRLPEWLA